MALAEPLGADVGVGRLDADLSGWDVGTAKPTSAERATVTHHLVDVAEPHDSASVARFQLDGSRPIDERIETRTVGGSGLYYRALVDRLELPGTDEETRRQLETEARPSPPGDTPAPGGHDSDAAAKIEPANVRRLVRALEVAAIAGRRFSSYAEA